MNMQRHAYWIKSGAYTLLQRMFILLFGFGGFFLLVRMLDKETFGIWALFLTITTLTEQAKNGLVQNALVKHLASAEPHEEPEIMTASWIINSGLSLLLMLLFFLAAQPLAAAFEAPILVPMMYAYSLNILILLPFSQFQFIQQAKFDFRAIFFSTFFRQGLLFGYIVFLFLAHREVSLPVLVLVQAMGLLIGSFIGFYYVKKHLSLSIGTYRPWVRRLYDYGKFVLGTNVSSMLLKSTDQLMLGALLGPAFVAPYNAAARIVNVVEVPSFTMATVVFPKSAQRIKTEGKAAVKSLYEKSVGAVLALLFPLLLLVLLLPSIFMLVLAGKQYQEYASLLQIVVLFSFFIPFSRQFGTMMDSAGLPKVNFLQLLFLAVVNVGLNYVLISTYGLMGAAYATLSTYSIGFILNQYLLYRYFEVSTMAVFQYMLKAYVKAPGVILQFFKRPKACISK